MKAKVTMLRSGAAYEDKQRRVRIEFADASFAYRELELPEGVLGLRDVTLDMELEVEVEVAVAPLPIDGVPF